MLTKNERAGMAAACVLAVLAAAALCVFAAWCGRLDREQVPPVPPHRPVAGAAAGYGTDRLPSTRGGVFRAQELALVSSEMEADRMIREERIAAAAERKKRKRQEAEARRMAEEEFRSDPARVHPLESGHRYYCVRAGSAVKTLRGEWQDCAWRMCVKYGIPEYYGLVIAQMWQESSFNPWKVSPTQDYGLMQINIANHAMLKKQLGLPDVTSPEHNIEAGVYMMSCCLHEFGDSRPALTGYNMGGGAVRYRHLWSSSYARDVLSVVPLLEETGRSL